MLIIILSYKIHTIRRRNVIGKVHAFQYGSPGSIPGGIRLDGWMDGWIFAVLGRVNISE